jgi:hypothetical protein
MFQIAILTADIYYLIAQIGKELGSEMDKLVADPSMILGMFNIEESSPSFNSTILLIQQVDREIYFWVRYFICQSSAFCSITHFSLSASHVSLAH